MPELGIVPGIVATEAAIEVDGQDRPRLAAGLLELVVEETTEGLYSCEARFGNWGTIDGGVGYLYLGRDVLDFGKSLVVRLGSGDGEGEVFRGRITAIESQYRRSAPPAVTVLAEDRAQDLRMVRRSRVFEDMTDADVFGQIAGEHGLQSEIDAPGPSHAALAQVNQSDLAFIRERARWLDAEVWLTDRTLHVQSRVNRTPGGQDLSLMLDQGLLEFTVSADLARQHTSVVASGWDVAAKDKISFEATDSAITSELGNMDSGASILAEAFGDRVDQIVHSVPLTSSEAEGLANATFRAQARQFVCGSGLAMGDARLRVGATVAINGAGPMFEGAYYVSRARHVFMRRPGGGYRTEFSVERPGVGS